MRRRKFHEGATGDDSRARGPSPRESRFMRASLSRQSKRISLTPSYPRAHPFAHLFGEFPFSFGRRRRRRKKGDDREKGRDDALMLTRRATASAFPPCNARDSIVAPVIVNTVSTNEQSNGTESKEVGGQGAGTGAGGFATAVRDERG